MKTVAPYAKMLNPLRGLDVTDEDGENPQVYNLAEYRLKDGIAALRRIEYAARVSHRSEDKITENSYDRFLRSVVLQHGDMSVIEHESVTCEFLVDRGITHELVRHRIGSYTQESTRFVNYNKEGQEAAFVCPFGQFQGISDEDCIWEKAILASEEAYKALIKEGVAPQIARSIFPNALASKIIITYNLRSWRHFFIMRTSKEAHPQMKQVTIPLLAEFKEKIPILYEDIEPESRQAEAMKKLR